METPADKAKREAAEKAAAKVETDKKAAEEAAKAEADRIANMSEAEVADDAENTESEAERGLAERKEAKEEAYDKMFRVTATYPTTTPNEHVVFGFGGERIQLGDLRALFGQRRP